MFKHRITRDIRVPDHIEVRQPGAALGRGGITATIIETTYHHEQARPLITMQLRYPRFIHAEFMTHRDLSRNASSSRAIPVAKMIEQVRTDPAMPIHWGKNQPGMQADHELSADEAMGAITAWKIAAQRAADNAGGLNALGLHKQVVNRILEPFQFMHVIVTATNWDNFFDLRAHKDAQPEIQELAYTMLAAARSVQPRHVWAENRIGTPWYQVDQKNWHLPYVTADERASLRLSILLSISAARCARVSYLKRDGTTSTVGEDVRLFQRLVGSTPLHASPIEHQAYGVDNIRSGNFNHFRQFREIYSPTDEIWRDQREAFAEAEALS